MSAICVLFYLRAWRGLGHSKYNITPMAMYKHFLDTDLVRLDLVLLPLPVQTALPRPCWSSESDCYGVIGSHMTDPFQQSMPGVMQIPLSWRIAGDLLHTFPPTNLEYRTFYHSQIKQAYSGKSLAGLQQPLYENNYCTTFDTSFTMLAGRNVAGHKFST